MERFDILLKISRVGGKNNMIPSVTSFQAFFGSEQDVSENKSHRPAQGGHIFGITKVELAGCVLLSLILHVLGGWLADFRPVQELIQDRLILLDIVTPAPTPPAEPLVAPAPVKVPLTETERTVPVPSPDVKMSAPDTLDGPVHTAVSEKTMPEKIVPRVKPESRVQNVSAPEDVHKTASVSQTDVKSAVPIGQIVPREGVTVLANESGQDALKHGAEARFMHGVATEEFVEENYIGEYSLGKAGKVWIEDDRGGSGHLILHAESMGLRRPLFRFNRFIYVYGEKPDSPEPILGSVTFFSDGYHIHQFLWQHNSTHAYFPRRD
ncbi:hypothetical protein [Desulfomicrobium apsheronum]|nr:hypothetical protein [Desulfomicrobium apsheronum]